MADTLIAQQRYVKQPLRSDLPIHNASDFWQIDEDAVLRPPLGDKFEIVVDIFFNASHFVINKGYKGPVHSHAYRFQAKCISQRLTDQDQVVVGYEHLRDRMRTLAQAYNNQLLNDLPPFERLQPTTENLTAILFQQLDRMLKSIHISLSNVTIWESPTESITYSRS